MREWSQYCLIDIFSHIDPALLEDDQLENDLEMTDLWKQEKEKWSKKKIAVITGIATGAVALTGAVVYFCARNHKMKKTA